MEVSDFLSMVGGTGDTSYAANSKLQEDAVLKIRPMLEEAVGEVHKNLRPEKMVVADLGCSSGPNTFLVLSELIKIISKQCQMLGIQPPETQLFLNDLPKNDFNNLFQLLEYFKGRVQEDNGVVAVPYFVAGLPGSFYGRLFPKQSVHFFHSSYSQQWMSQVPEGLDNKKEDVPPPNKGNVYIGKTSPPLVVKLYQEQFQRDFSRFLKLRFIELVPGGRMVVAFPGRKNKDIYSGELSSLFGLVSESLNSMVIEGLVQEEKLDSFNIPNYAPSMEEAKVVINAQRLFDIIQIEMFESNWDPNDSDHDIVIDNIKSGLDCAKCIRAVLESMITSHFGSGIVDDLFSRFAVNVANNLSKDKTKLAVLSISLKKKEQT